MLKREEITAYHEAAHAIVCSLMRRKFCYVTIRPDITEIPSDTKLGHVKFCGLLFKDDQLGKDISSKMRKRIEKEILCYLAGAVSEKIFNGRVTTVSREDTAKAYDLAKYIVGGSKEVEPYVNSLYGKTDAYIDSLFAKTRELLLSHWKAVERLANDLLMHKTIDHRRVREILKQVS
jgi:ATP-dependent Zn protease